MGKTIVFMCRCTRCGTEESNSGTGDDFPTVCRNCGAYGGDLSPFLLVGDAGDRYIFERPTAVGGSLILLTTGHSQFVAVESAEIAELVEAKIEEGGPFLKLASSTDPGFAAFLNPLEIAGVLPKPGRM
jgi:hypothetical protein